MMNARQSPFDAATLKWLWDFVRPHRWRVAGVAALSLVATALALVQPYLTKLMIDRGLLARRFEVVVTLAAVMIGVSIAALALGGLNRILYTDASARVLFAMRESVYAHLLRLSPAFHARVRGGDLMARLDGDVSEIQRFCVDSILAGINGVAALLVTLTLLVSLSWRLSILALVLLPAEALFLRAMRPRVEMRTRRLRERASDLAGFFFETIPAVKFVQSVGAEDQETQRLRQLNRSYLSDLINLQIVDFITGAIPGLLTSVSGAVLFVAGGYMVIAGSLTLGGLVAFYSYLARATSPVQTLLGLYVATQRARVSLDRVRELTLAQPAVTPPVAPIHLPAYARGEIRIENVSFSYDPAGPAILTGANMIVPAAAKVGVVGASGIGKTTIVDLFQRHFDPDSGRILIDGMDLRALDLAELRRRVSVIAQDTVLFSGTIFDNLRYAAPQAGERELMAAAEHARVTDFAVAFPLGMRTEIGGRGAALSGGQRQRLAIARALLREPLVLIMDEATSAIDLETEALIAAEIDRLFADRTRIVISHRPQSIAGADLIYRLCDGRLGLERPVSASMESSRWTT